MKKKEKLYTLNEIAERYELPVTCLNLAHNSHKWPRLTTVSLDHMLLDYPVYIAIDGYIHLSLEHTRTWIPVQGTKRRKK